MKKLLFLIAFTGLKSVYAQTDTLKLNIPFDDTHTKVLYSVKENCDLSKIDLFKNAQKWIADNVDHYRSAVQLEDKEEGRIIAKCNYDTSNSSSILFTISIDVKDNKYRIQMYDITRKFDILGTVNETKLEDMIKRDLAKKPKSRQLLIKYLNEDDEKLRIVLISARKSILKKDDF